MRKNYTYIFLENFSVHDISFQTIYVYVLRISHYTYICVVLRVCVALDRNLHTWKTTFVNTTELVETS